MYLVSNIRYLRKAHGLSQEKFASVAGATRAMISEYEKGKSKPNYDVIIAISKNFNISIDDLMLKDLANQWKETGPKRELKIEDIPDDFDSVKYLIHDIVDNSFHTRALGEYLTRIQMKLTGKSRTEVDAEIKELYEEEREKAKARIKK